MFLYKNPIHLHLNRGRQQSVHYKVLRASCAKHVSQCPKVQGRQKSPQMQQAIVTGFRQAQAPHQAGDASQIGAQAQGGQDDHQPEEGGGAGAGRAERLEGAPKENRSFGKARKEKR